MSFDENASNVVKGPWTKEQMEERAAAQKMVDSVPDRIPLTPELKAELGIGGAVKEDIRVMSDGRRYRVTKDGPWEKIDDAPGTIKGMPWNERALRAERVAKLMIEERERLKDVLLNSCGNLRACKFSCESGPLEDSPDFIMIEAFAKGIPGDVRPVLASLRKDGIRAVEKIKDSEIMLECWHRYGLQEMTATLHDEVECPKCVELLKARGWYEAAKEVVPAECNDAEGKGKTQAPAD